MSFPPSPSPGNPGEGRGEGVFPFRILHSDFCIQKRSAFTLIELTLATAVTSLVFAGLMSAMVIAARSTGDTTSDTVSPVAAASRAADVLNLDLATAITVTEKTATSLTLTTLDRTGDAVPETIRYSWSGVAGAPVYRAVNNTQSVLLAGAKEFALAYDTKTTANAVTYTNAAEATLASYAVGFLPSDSDVKSSNWCGEYFVPTLPSNAARFSVTKLRLYFKSHGPAIGTCKVQLRECTSGGLPTTVIEEGTVSESSLTTSYAMVETRFRTVTGRTPGTGLCIVVQWLSDADACDLQYNPATLASNMTMVTTTNGGQTWTTNLSNLSYAVLGQSATANAVTSKTTLTNVRATIRVGSDATTRVRSAVKVLNEPDVTGL